MKLYINAYYARNLTSPCTFEDKTKLYKRSIDVYKIASTIINKDHKKFFLKSIHENGYMIGTSYDINNKVILFELNFFYNKMIYDRIVKHPIFHCTTNLLRLMNSSNNPKDSFIIKRMPVKIGMARTNYKFM